MAEALAVWVFVLLVSAAVLVILSRRSEHHRAVLWVGAGVCLVLFLILNVSDWPVGFLAAFWRDHPVVSASAGALLLVAIGYFGFEGHERLLQAERDNRERLDQAERDSKVAAVARTGLVDHLVDLDAALSLVLGPREALEGAWPGWNDAGRPLRWLRHRRALRLDTVGGNPGEADPRAIVRPEVIDTAAWRVDIVDQMVRRLMGGIKEWGRVLAASREGQDDLMALGGLRFKLLQLEDELTEAPGAAIARADGLRLECRALAWSFEARSNAPRPRRELICPAGERPWRNQ